MEGKPTASSCREASPLYDRYGVIVVFDDGDLAHGQDRRAAPNHPTDAPPAVSVRGDTAV
jgi:hypothetical protein